MIDVINQKHKLTEWEIFYIYDQDFTIDFLETRVLFFLIGRPYDGLIQSVHVAAGSFWRCLV